MEGAGKPNLAPARPAGHIFGMRFLSVPVALLAATGCGERPRPPVVTDQSPAAARTVPGPAAQPLRSPDRYRAVFTTSKGSFTVEVTRSLAPRAADRFHELVQNGYYAGTRFYRVVPGFITQWGIHGDTAVSAQWQEATIPDDPPRTPNVRGTIAFAANGPDSRATEVFVSTGDNRRPLDRQRFAPFGTVIDGMDVVDRISAEYGEEPNYAKITRQGNHYLRRWFPALDSVVSTRLIIP